MLDLKKLLVVGVGVACLLAVAPTTTYAWGSQKSKLIKKLKKGLNRESFSNMDRADKLLAQLRENSGEDLEEAIDATEDFLAVESAKKGKAEKVIYIRDETPWWHWRRYGPGRHRRGFWPWRPWRHHRRRPHHRRHGAGFSFGINIGN
jgi:hypothetical protein